MKRNWTKAILISAALLALMVGGAQAASFNLVGDFVTVGVNSNGALINDSGTVGMQANAPITPFANDFLTPGTPWQFFAVRADGVNTSSSFLSGGNPFNMVMTDTSSALVRSAVGSGNIGNLAITETILFGKSEVYGPGSKPAEIGFAPVHIKFDFSNIGAATIADVAFATGFDPDQNVISFGDFVTDNSLGGRVVQANCRETILIGKIIDETATGTGVPSIVASWPQDNVTFLLTGPNSGTPGDYQISMAWALGDLLAGDHVTVDFDYLVGPVPVPPAVWLFGSGLLGLVGLRRKLKKA